MANGQVKGPVRPGESESFFRGSGITINKGVNPFIAAGRKQGQGGRGGGSSSGGSGGSGTQSSGPSAQQLRTKQRNDTKLQGQNLITRLSKEFKDAVRTRQFGDRNALLNAQKELRSKTAEISTNIKSLNLQIGGASLSDLKTKTFDVLKGIKQKVVKKETKIESPKFSSSKVVSTTGSNLFRPFISRPGGKTGKIKKFISKIDERFEEKIRRGTEKDVGLIETLGTGKGAKELFPKDRLRIETDTTITDEIPFTKSGRGTSTFNQREKTFFEKLGIDPEDKSSQKLKRDFGFIEREVEFGKLTPKEAELRLDDSIKKFTDIQAKTKGLKQNLAIGAAIGLLSATLPPAAVVASGVLGADFFLQRRKVLSQFSKFKKGDALGLAAFIAGSAIGRRVGISSAGKSIRPPKLSSSEVKLNLDSIGKITKVGGQQKTQLKKLVLENFEGVKSEAQFGKTSQFQFFRIPLKNGKVWDVVEVTKVNIKTGKSESNVFGFELAGKERFVGTAKGSLVKGVGKTYLSGVKFRQANTKLGNFLQKKGGFGKSTTFEILQKSKVGKSKRFGQTTTLDSQSVSGLFKLGKAKNRNVKNAAKLIDNLEKGKKVSLSKLKGVINNKRVIIGLEPFTEAEFASTKIRTLTNTQMINVLEGIIKANVKINQKFFGQKTGRINLKTRQSLTGLAESKLLTNLKGTKKPFVRKTPLDKTFPKSSLKIRFGESKLVQRGKQISNSKPFNKFKETSQTLIREVKKKRLDIPKLIRKETKQIQKGKKVPPSSLGASTLAASLPLPKSSGFPGGRSILKFTPEFSKGPLSLGITRPGISGVDTTPSVSIKTLQPTTLQAVTQFELLSIRNNLKLATKNLTKLKDIQSPTSITLTRVDNLEKQISNLRTEQSIKLNQQQKQKQQQRQRQKQSSAQTNRLRPQVKIPKIPFFPGDSISKRNIKLLVPPMDFGKGHNVFVKSKGKFNKVNLVPLRKSKAENLGAWLTDKSTSRSYKLKSTSKKPLKPKLIVPNNYFGSTRKKFRGKKFKGNIKPLGRFGVRIERSRHAIDSLQEKKQLSVARIRKQLVTKSIQKRKNIPSKLKSTRLIKRSRK